MRRFPYEFHAVLLWERCRCACLIVPLRSHASSWFSQNLPIPRRRCKTRWLLWSINPRRHSVGARRCVTLSSWQFNHHRECTKTTKWHVQKWRTCMTSVAIVTTATCARVCSTKWRLMPRMTDTMTHTMSAENFVKINGEQKAALVRCVLQRTGL